MKNLAQNGLSHEQVYDALHFKSGTSHIKFRYDLIRNGVNYKSIDVSSASVSLKHDDEISRTAKFTINGEQGIDWLGDMIKPYMLVSVNTGFKSLNCAAVDSLNITWSRFSKLKLSAAHLNCKLRNVTAIDKLAEFPLGVFVLSTPTKTTVGQYTKYEVEAYDQSIILREDCLTERYLMPKGTNYIDEIQELILSAGISKIIADISPIALPVDREFSIGESKLSIINKLLSEINFDKLCVNSEGAFLIQKYREPNALNLSYTYKDDELSVLYDESTAEQDFYNVPNVFIAVVSNVELEQDYRSVYVNSNPASKLSTISRKRKIVSEVYRPDVIASQADLDKYILKIAFEKSQVFETIKFSTALMPIHENNEILQIFNRNTSGIYQETAWDIELSVGGKMTHEARRITYI